MVINWDDRTIIVQEKHCRKISEQGYGIFFKTKQLFADRDSIQWWQNQKIISTFGRKQKNSLIVASKGSTNDLVNDAYFTY